MYQRVGLSLIVLVATVPFFGKAFHVDDPLYLAVARQILAKPWDPFGAEILWEKTEEPLFDADFNPPLWSYLLAPVLAITGEPKVTVVPAGKNDQGTPIFRAEPPSRLPEVAMHLVESIFVAAAIVALYLLSKRWVRWPLTATALVALSPAMLPGQNVMLEGPVMAFWLWSVWCHQRGIGRDDMRWIRGAGVLAALAVLTKYTSGLVILLLVVDSVRRRNWRSLCILVPPVAAIALWSLHNWLLYERLHVLVIFSRAQTGGREPLGVQLYESWGRLLAMFRAVGAITALALPVAGTVLRRRGVWVGIVLYAVSVGVGWLGQWDMADRLIERDGREPSNVFPENIPSHLLVFASLGAITLGGLALCGRGQGRVINEPATPRTGSCDADTFLWVWLLAVLIFGVFATPFLAIRHLLPGVPPLVWLVLRRLDESFSGSWQWLARCLLVPTVAISTVCGILVAKADDDWANWYRHLAVDVASRTVEAGRTRDKSVWYTGHWGWAYYAERVGIKPYIPGRTQMGEGDFLLMPLVQTWQLPPQELKPYLHGLLPPIQPTPKPIELTGNLTVDKTLDWCLNSVRTISNEVHLYGSGTVTVPWQFSRKPLEFFRVIEVKSDPTKRDASGAALPVDSTDEQRPIPNEATDRVEPPGEVCLTSPDDPVVIDVD